MKFSLGIALAAVFTCWTPALAQNYTLEVLIPGHGFNGIHGLTFDPEDELYVGSVIGQSIYKVDPETGEAHTHVGPPEGMADDLEFGPDGTLAWTSFTIGILHAQKDGGPIQRLATGLPGINSLAWTGDGRLFASQVFLGDALYEFDPEGDQPPRKILEDIGGLNGFDFGPDGLLYGPLWFKGEVVKIDVDSGEMTTVTGGFETPAAVNFNSRGDLYVLDTKAGIIYRLDVNTGVRHEVSHLQTAMDNLAFDSNDRLFVTVMANNAIYEVDTQTGEARTVKEGKLAVPCDIAVVEHGTTDMLYLSDIFSLRSINAQSREVTDIARNYSDELENPIGVFADEDTILAISWFSGTVQQFNRHTGESAFIAHDFAAPMDAVILPNGDWAVLELGTSSLVRASGPEKDTRAVIAQGLAGGVCLALGPAGSVYVTRAGGNIDRVDLESGEVTPVATGLALPEGIDTAPDGTLVVAEVGKQRLVRVDPATGGVTEIMGGLTIGLPTPAGNPPSYTPTGVAVSANGTIYFTSDIEDAIYRLTPR